MKKEIEMKNDGKDYDRFHALLQKVVRVPKKDIQEKEEKDRQEKFTNTGRKTKAL